jgi:hypothetical protein
MPSSQNTFPAINRVATIVQSPFPEKTKTRNDLKERIIYCK